MVFNATFNNIPVISWRSVLLVKETGVLGENHRPQGQIQDFKLGGEGELKKVAPPPPWIRPWTCRKSLTNFIT